MKFGKDIYAPGTKHYKRYMVATELKNQKNDRGEKLCAWCGKVLENKRLKYCSDECSNEVYIRSGRSTLLRVAVRDGGVCVICGLKTANLKSLLIRSAESKHGPRYRYFYHRMLMRFGLTNSEAGNSLWQADHIIPVKKGGGCCGLENLRTLCVWCHKKETKKLAQERDRK
jgi:5-methylcytosine-specific restriction endonuclease McrA